MIYFTQKKAALAALGLVALIASPLTMAGPADYVYTPTVEYGEKEIDFKLGTIKPSGSDRESATSLGFGYGATQYWFTELYGKFKRESERGTFFDAYEWENKFQLTETGKYPVDVGFILEIERPKDRSEGYEVKFGPLFQTEFDKTQLNFNLLFQRNYRTEEANHMQLGYQVQAKYRWKPTFEFGVQGFGELGDWDHWAPRSEQSHRFGPAVFGKIALGGRNVIKYNAGLLFGVNDPQSSTTFRSQVEYEF